LFRKSLAGVEHFRALRAARCTSHPASRAGASSLNRRVFFRNLPSFALVRREEVAEVLALASFGRSGVSAARTALGRARRPRARHRQEPPASFRTGLALPTLLRPLTLLVGTRAPAPRLQPRRRLTLLHTRQSRVNPNTQSGNTSARTRSAGVHARNACRLANTDDSRRQRRTILT